MMVDRQKFEEWCKELASVVGPSLFVLNGEFRFRMSIDLEAFYERQEAVRDEALDLQQFINAADIGGGDAPHQVVEKLQRAINAAALKREPSDGSSKLPSHQQPALPAAFKY